MRDWLIPIVFSVIAVLLQIVFAPVLTIFSVVPNFIVAYVIVLSLLRRPDSTYGYAFVLGLISDLLSQTPLGLTPLLLLVLSFILSRAFEVMDQSSPSVALITCAVGCLAFQLVFMIVLLIVGYDGGFFDLLLYRALPATVIGALLCALFYLIMRRFPFTQPANDAWKVAENVRF